MSEKTRERIARELLTVIKMKGTPDIIVLDCALKAKYASPQRPWPYASPEDALACFKKVAAEGQKKYAGVKISIEKDALLRLERIG